MKLPAALLLLCCVTVVLANTHRGRWCLTPNDGTEPRREPRRRARNKRHMKDKLNPSPSRSWFRKQPQRQSKQRSDSRIDLKPIMVPFFQKFFQKSADSTVSAAKKSVTAIEASPQTFQQSSAHIKKAALAQQAQIETSRANKVKHEIRDIQKRKKLKILSEEDSEKLTATEARRLLKFFQARKNSGLNKDIVKLSEEEKVYKDSTQAEQSATKRARLAEYKVDQAVIAEKLAKQRVKEAKQHLVDIQKGHNEAQRLEMVALSEESKATSFANQAWRSMDDARERVRSSLLQCQNVYLEKEASHLKHELRRLEASSSKVNAQAKRARRELHAMGE